MTDLINKIQNKEACVGVIGLGYVGLPLLIEFAKADFPILGFDIDEKKTTALKEGRSYIKHIKPENIAAVFIEKDHCEATTDFSRVPECDVLILCLPTPLGENRDPDLSYIEKTAETIAPHLRKKQLVVLESSTYPGTTEEVMIPILEKGSGLTAGTDFCVAYSPEREDPNNKDYSTSTIPKVVGGIDKPSLDAACALYNHIICKTIVVSDCRTAEATKLMENIFRCVNIALVNEAKMIFTKMGIDVWEVIRAASTKPFGFMPFYPGPGLGGHCIPIDPFYLTWKAREYGMATRFIELAGEINTAMPGYVVDKSIEALKPRELPGSRVLLIGLAYKKNVDDDRESPTYELWHRFEKLGAEVDYYDPFCPKVRRNREFPEYADIESVSWDDVISGKYDLIVVSTAHDVIDFETLCDKAKLIVDTRGACPARANVVKA